MKHKRQQILYPAEAYWKLNYCNAWSDVPRSCFSTKNDTHQYNVIEIGHRMFVPETANKMLFWGFKEETKTPCTEKQLIQIQQFGLGDVQVIGRRPMHPKLAANHKELQHQHWNWSHCYYYSLLQQRYRLPKDKSNCDAWLDQTLQLPHSCFLHLEALNNILCPQNCISQRDTIQRSWRHQTEQDKKERVQWTGTNTDGWRLSFIYIKRKERNAMLANQKVTSQVSSQQ